MTVWHRQQKTSREVLCETFESDALEPESTVEMAEQLIGLLTARGFAVVPMEPTPEMMKAWRADKRESRVLVSPKRTWRVMIAAVTGIDVWSNERETGDG